MYNPEYFHTLLSHSVSPTYAMYLYNSVTDTNEHYNDIISEGYFNQVNIDNPDTLWIGDFITVMSIDGHGNYMVDAISPNIVLVPKA